ncbi:MAG: hypothetical protein ACOZQL_12065 [Myxococcota bacterium]
MLLLVAASVRAQVLFAGDVVLIRDPNGAITNLVGMNNQTIFPSHQEQFCRAAFNAARAGGLADEFDGVITFSTAETLTDLDNVWQGSPVRADGSGYGRTNSPSMNSYDSSKLGQCVFMGTLGRTSSLFGGFGPEALPSDPDADWAPSLGIPIPGVKSLTGIEMMGHEYGHHWLMGIEFDQNDARGRQHFIRGFTEDQNGGGSPNQHYSRYADSRSVMYGECITDLGNGSFRLEGCARKYSHLDQYLMGLRAPSEVSPMMVLEDPASPGRGTDTVAMGRTTGATTVSGYSRHDITADEIIRAMGSRVPAYPTARNCWRVAFIVVLAPGQTAIPQAMLDKVNRYRARWSPWFSFATDGRGTMDTRINGNGCLVMTTDAGVTIDAGTDAGIEADAGTNEPDAGSEPDAGMTEEDAGAAVPDAGTPEPGVDAGYRDPWETGKLREGCGCASGGELGAIAFVLLALARRRR